MQKKQSLKTTTCSRIYKILNKQITYSGSCWICWKRSGKLNTGCNGIWKKKTERNWKKFRKTQYRKI